MFRFESAVASFESTVSRSGLLGQPQAASTTGAGQAQLALNQSCARTGRSRAVVPGRAQLTLASNLKALCDIRQSSDKCWARRFSYIEAKNNETPAANEELKKGGNEIFLQRIFLLFLLPEQAT